MVDNWGWRVLSLPKIPHPQKIFDFLIESLGKCFYSAMLSILIERNI